jgi:hypothetical protein
MDARLNAEPTPNATAFSGVRLQQQGLITELQSPPFQLPPLPKSLSRRSWANQQTRVAALCT